MYNGEYRLWISKNLQRDELIPNYGWKTIKYTQNDTYKVIETLVKTGFVPRNEQLKNFDSVNTKIEVSNEKIKKSDFVIYNNSDIDNLKLQINNLLSLLQ